MRSRVYGKMEGESVALYGEEGERISTPAARTPIVIARSDCTLWFTKTRSRPARRMRHFLRQEIGKIYPGDIRECLVDYIPQPTGRDCVVILVVIQRKTLSAYWQAVRRARLTLAVDIVRRGIDLRRAGKGPLRVSTPLEREELRVGDGCILSSRLAASDGVCRDLTDLPRPTNAAVHLFRHPIVGTPPAPSLFLPSVALAALVAANAAVFALLIGLLDDRAALRTAARQAQLSARTLHVLSDKVAERQRELDRLRSNRPRDVYALLSALGEELAGQVEVRELTLEGHELRLVLAAEDSLDALRLLARTGRLSRIEIVEATGTAGGGLPTAVLRGVCK